MSAEPAYNPSMTRTLMTADELLHLNIPDKRSELVKGVLIVREPPGIRHGRVAMALARVLANHVDEHSLGVVYAAETGFTLARHPDTVRAPDVSFIRRDRLPDPEPSGYSDVTPDLVVEVLSPGDRPEEMLAKVGDWLTAGTRLVWLVDPERRHARVYRQDGTETVVGAEESLDGEDVLPGLLLQLSAVL